MYTSSDTELSFFIGNSFIPLTSVLNQKAKHAMAAGQRCKGTKWNVHQCLCYVHIQNTWKHGLIRNKI